MLVLLQYMQEDSLYNSRVERDEKSFSGATDRDEKSYSGALYNDWGPRHQRLPDVKHRAESNPIDLLLAHRWAVQHHTTIPTEPTTLTEHLLHTTHPISLLLRKVWQSPGLVNFKLDYAGNNESGDDYQEPLGPDLPPVMKDFCPRKIFPP